MCVAPTSSEGRHPSLGDGLGMQSGPVVGLRGTGNRVVATVRPRVAAQDPPDDHRRRREHSMHLQGTQPEGGTGRLILAHRPVQRRDERSPCSDPGNGKPCQRTKSTDPGHGRSHLPTHRAHCRQLTSCDRPLRTGIRGVDVSTSVVRCPAIGLRTIVTCRVGRRLGGSTALEFVQGLRPRRGQIARQLLGTSGCGG